MAKAKSNSTGITTKAKNRTKKSINSADETEKLYRRLDRERKPALPGDTAEQIESFLRDTGYARRLALAYLSTTWREITQAIQKDREDAKAFVTVQRAVGDHAQKYQDLADLMRTAHARLTIAVAVRDDLREIMAELETEEAAEVEHAARKVASTTPAKRACGI